MDAQTLVVQIRRPLRVVSKVAARCALRLPIVAEVPPTLDSGEPFPTLYWLSCPLAHRRIARLEAAGGVREADMLAKTSPDFAKQLLDAHTRYAKQREALTCPETQRPASGGVGGSRGGVKCLHAHFADHAAGNDNPVGQMVAERIGALNCDEPCVAIIDGEVAKNPRWAEPPTVTKP